MPAKATTRRARANNLSDAINAIENAGAQDRLSALDNLIFLFDKRNKHIEVVDLKDKEYHRTLEAIFRCVNAEKTSYYKVRKGKTNATTSANRLTKCAEAMRIVLDHGATKLKRKTLMATIDHVTQTLPNSEEGYVQPLLLEYVRALLAMLSYPSVVELLATSSAVTWVECVDFILEIIAWHLESHAGNATPSRDSPAPGTPLTLSHPISTLRSTATSSSQRGGHGVHQTVLHSLLECLHLLISAPNAPVLKRSQQITTAALQCIRLRFLGLSAVLQLGFSVLNVIVQATQTEDTRHTNELTAEVLPLIRQWWQAKTTSQENALLNSIQVEVLKLLFNIHLNVAHLAQSGDSGIVTELEELCDMLWNQYSQREGRSQLSEDDLTFSTIPQHIHALQVASFALRLYNMDAERRWAIIHILAIFEAILWMQSQSRHDAVEEDEHPRKRRRIAASSNRLHQKLQIPQDNMRIAALQLIPFFVSRVRLSTSDLTETLSTLASLVGHKNIRLSVWATIASASIAPLNIAGHDDLLPTWKQLWYMAARNLSISASCRASSALLAAIVTNDLLSYHEISDDINSIITAADVSGPSVVVDSSVILMTKLLQLRNYRLPSASHATCNHVIRWLFLRWDPADPVFISAYSAHVAPLDIINLFRASYGQSSLVLSGHPQLVSGPLVENWSMLRDRLEIVRYILLLDEEVPQAPGAESARASPSQYSLQNAETADSHAVRKLIAELLHPKAVELQSLCESWSKRGEGSSQMTVDKFRSLLNCLLVITFTLAYTTDLNTRHSQELNTVSKDILRDAFRIACTSSENPTFLEAVLQTVRPYLPACSTAALTSMYESHPQVLSFFSELSSEFRDRESQQSSVHIDDTMDLDEDFETQESRSSTISRTVDVCRRDTALLDKEAFFYDTTQRLNFLHAIHEDPGQIGLVPSVFLTELLAQSDEELVCCRLMNKELFSADLTVSQDDAMRVIHRFFDVIYSTNFYSCEVALHACIDTIEGFINIWVDERSDLSSAIEQLYEFLLEKALTNNLLSPRTQIALTRLLFHLTEIDEKFPERFGLPTTISSLFSMLQHSSISIKFFIGNNLHRIFNRFVLKTHDQYCIDVVNSLPLDPEMPEGISLRLYILSQLAKNWPTLLRRCVYHIFETPGHLLESTRHATYCLKDVALSLKLENAQALFDLFAPQLLYTWLNTDPIESIPFGIFGFQTLEDLLQRAQSEAAAILMMRGQDEDFANLAALLGQKPAELAGRCFSKILAYSMAYDISMPKSDQHTNGESRIRKLLGRETFLSHVCTEFVDVIGTFFGLIDQEDPIEKSWAKDESCAYAADIMAEIKSYSHSDVELSGNQQPYFRAKYLTREISILCSRTEHEMKHMFTPALVVSVARRLLNTIHSALGSLHACSVIRKVRVLLCLAGQSAYESYTLEMLLHSMQPYLTDLESADDALGISQYLLVRGLPTLSRVPSFVAGYALSTLASLRVFLESSQASTTQESQFKATMNKAQSFHKWLSQYLEKYQSPVLRDEKQLSSFRSITQSAASVRSSGNAERGTHESTLLLEILRDQGRETQLLNESSRQSALRILAKDFRLPAPSQQDAIDLDSEATDFATAIWKTLYAQPDGNEYRNYRVWAGRAIGKSFAASGHVDESLLRESKLTKYLQHAPSSASSEKGLLSLLQALTSDADCFTAGLAESALRNIVSEAASVEDNVLSEACGTVLSEQLLISSDWAVYRTPPSDALQVDVVSETSAFAPEAFEDPPWARQLMIHLTQSAKKDVVLSALPQVLRHVKGFAEDAFPFIIHLVLMSERDKQQSAKKNLSAALKPWLKTTGPTIRERLGLLINAILYLRAQKIPGEHSIADRSQWLEVDLATAATAATRCGMHKTALLLVESSSTEGSRQSRRSSAIRAQESTDVLLEIFENIDDPDAYYGLQDGTDLSNILARLEYENDGAKSLAFRGAQFDSHTRKRDVAVRLDERHLVKTLNTLGLSGLSHSLLQAQQSHDGASATVDSTFVNARRLEIWDLPVPASTENPSVALYKAYQGCNQAGTSERVAQAIQGGFYQVMQNLINRDAASAHIRSNLGTLAALSEMDDTLNISSSSGLNDLLTTFDARLHWMNSGRYDDVSHLLSTRWTTLSMLGKSIQTQPRGDLKLQQIKLVEARSLLSSSGKYRFHSAQQESLNIATALNDSIEQAADLGLAIDAAAKIEVAHSLWDHGEMVSSIRMLQGVAEDSDLKKQDIEVRRSDLLAEIGHQVSVARLEKPESIQRNYLQPALKELKGKVDGPEAGKVYHQFARFCDEQLQNPDGLEDLARLQHLKQGKSDEVAQLQQIVRNSKEADKKRRAQAHLVKAKQWLELDDQELRRVEQSRSEFVRLSLENYLLSLTASDEHDNDALRFTALWLERAEEDYTSEAVKKYIDKVPTRKFATLMNQLTSRLIDQPHLFQKLLIELIYRICMDHPYHGMYQVWSGTKSRHNKEDEVAVLRQKATERIAKRLSQGTEVSSVWRAIDKTNKAYHLLAVDRDESRYKAGLKVAIKDCPNANKLVLELAQYRIPPPTLQIELASDRDYSHVPHVSKVEPSMSIASGVSAPKIITLVGSDGRRYRQLVKGGSDDLRQDAIMEQVFAAASSVLKRHRSTQQRNLGIRTYKVLPLTASSGLIEFVPNTTPLHEYLMPAHERYHPKDLKGSSCRKEISQVQSKSVETRLATYKRVTERFQPVMRYFFMEYFVDPDEWYAKRTNYTRTTAAISILGHVLGLGDRHGHNILLDTATGEVVHIDLGVAFEMGRVLPVPELVPFRLTRDIVDGMGVTKTEGIFRRCCEFTLDALREETYSMMTILDVLRYDPLYSWSISPVRMAKLQDTRRDEEAGADAAADSVIDLKKKGTTGGLVNEPSEADRALEVVRKKLSKTLSVTATVNDLINQAVDERNLAVLYSGWAAYA